MAVEAAICCWPETVPKTGQHELPELSRIPLHDPQRGMQNLALIWGRVPVGVTGALPPLLTEVPDPDAALNLFERLTESGAPELFRMLDQHRPLVHYALVVFGYSRFLGETLLKNVDLLQTFLREETLDRSHSRDEFRESFARFRSRSFETDIALLLARFKRREYIRIMLRDVLGLATLAETTGEISSLADVLIEEALRECESVLHRRFGMAQHKDEEGRFVDTPFTVLALGKLGGNELNYSSDIDLLFLYGDGEREDDAAISNREYFVRLAQQVTDVLSRVTAEGAVFRIDLRLRPQGSEGEAAVSMGHALGYYAGVAHDWERQAMIKIRHCAGDVALARRFIRAVQPYVYTENLNFTAIETALEARDRMQESRRVAVARNENEIDVKLDRGGIRDIEFLVQCMQRVYGGSERWLRSGGTMFSLQKLHDKQHITGSDFHQLTTAYEFLRTVEHRLQLRQGQQTHRLPSDPHELVVLRRSLSAEHGEDAPSDVVRAVRERMKDVAEIYHRVIHQQRRQQKIEVATGSFVLHAPRVEAGRVHSDHQVLRRLAIDSPFLHELASREDLEPHTRKNLFKFLTSAFTSAERYAAVLDDAGQVERAVPLFAISEFATDLLVRHPEDIAALRNVQSRNDEQLQLLAPVHEPIPAALPKSLSAEEKHTFIRRRFRERLFLSAARDVLNRREVFESLAETSHAADEAIASALELAGKPEGFAIMALGRLGTCEFDFLSDADLIFVRETKMPVTTANRTAEQVMEILSAYTQAGSAFPVDNRLRPHGSEGELTVTPAQLNEYFAAEAKPWEALTYTKLRFVAGSEELGTAALSAANCLRERFHNDEEFVAAVREMRMRLEKNETTGMNLKTGPGGLYDIDFIVAYLLIRLGVQAVEGNTSKRLRTISGCGALSPNEGEQLHADLVFLRTLEHAIRLVTAKAGKSVPNSEVARNAIHRYLRQTLAHPLDAPQELAIVCKRVRATFERILA